MRIEALRQLASIAAPPRCGGCGQSAGARAALCTTCSEELRRAAPLIDSGPAGIDVSVAAADYSGRARRVAHGLKFGHRLALAAVAAEAVLAACPPRMLRGGLVPVPAAPLRWRWRGFDPAEEIALALAARTGLPFAPCLRRRGGPRQVGRPRSLRVCDPPRVWVQDEAPGEVLLVDDVRTTGSTLCACAAALREAGSTRVVALTFARTRPLPGAGGERRIVSQHPTEGGRP